MPRFYRQAPLNSIWEGSGNVICLDVVRAKRNIPNLLEELHSTRGVDVRYDNYVDQLTKDLMSMETNLDLGAVRHIVDRTWCSISFLKLRNTQLALRFEHRYSCSSMCFLTSR